MPMLNPFEVENMRDEVADTLLDMHCDVERYTEGAPDGIGQPTFTWASHLTNLPCHYWETDEAELEGTQQVRIVSHRLVAAANVDISADDRVIAIRDLFGLTVNTNILDIEEVINAQTNTLLVLRGVQ